MTHWSQKNYNGNKEYLDKTNNEMKMPHTKFLELPK